MLAQYPIIHSENTCQGRTAARLYGLDLENIRAPFAIPSSKLDHTLEWSPHILGMFPHVVPRGDIVGRSNNNRRLVVHRDVTPPPPTATTTATATTKNERSHCPIGSELCRHCSRLEEIVDKFLLVPSFIFFVSLA